MGRPKGSKNIKTKPIQFEWQICKCGCNQLFECLATSKKVYIYGHNNKGKSLLLGYKRNEDFKSKHRVPRPYARIPRENRYCACGCGLTFICKENSKRTHINGHNYFGYSKQGCVDLPRLGSRLRYRSSWEEAAELNLDKDLRVLDLQFESVYIPYQFNGKTHMYKVDFTITLPNNQILLVEVKPDYRLEDPWEQAKIAAGYKYAQENRCIYQVWNETICFNQASVTTTLSEVIQMATIATQEIGLRDSLNSIAI